MKASLKTIAYANSDGVRTSVSLDAELFDMLARSLRNPVLAELSVRRFAESAELMSLEERGGRSVSRYVTVQVVKSLLELAKQRELFD